MKPAATHKNSRSSCVKKWAHQKICIAFQILYQWLEMTLPCVPFLKVKMRRFEIYISNMKRNSRFWSLGRLSIASLMWVKASSSILIHLERNKGMETPETYPEKPRFKLLSEVSFAKFSFKFESPSSEISSHLRGVQSFIVEDIEIYPSRTSLRVFKVIRCPRSSSRRVNPSFVSFLEL